MEDEEFDKKCAKYMGYQLEGSFEYEGHIVKCYCLNGQFICLESTYKPHKDMNQMAEVVDKAMAEKNRNLLVFVEVGCKHAMRKFITECWR